MVADAHFIIKPRFHVFQEQNYVFLRLFHVFLFRIYVFSRTNHVFHGRIYVNLEHFHVFSQQNYVFSPLIHVFLVDKHVILQLFQRILLRFCLTRRSYRAASSVKTLVQARCDPRARSLRRLRTYFGRIRAAYRPAMPRCGPRHMEE
jgi:hypothetical protein